MKKLLIIALAVTCCYACKKDKDPGKQLLLHKMYEDGLLRLEYLYSADKKPYRRNVYSVGNGQSEYAGFRLYQYQNGLPVESSDFSSNNNFQSRVTITWDQNKRPSRLDYYNSNNDLHSYYTLDYNASGQLTSYSVFLVATNKKTFEAQFTWDQQGQIAGINRYTVSGTSKVKYDSATYQFENKPFPAWWNYYEMIPAIALPKGDNTFYFLICTNSFNYEPDTPPRTNDITISDRTYNAEGLLVKLRMASKSTGVFGSSSSTAERTYEYTE